MLWGFWYPALRSEQVRGQELEARHAAGSAAGDGARHRRKAFCAARCVPAPRVSLYRSGRFDGAAVECAYHGWQFDAHTGQCRTIPSLTADSKLKCERIYAGSFPCEERDGYIWAFMANPEGRAPESAAASPVPALPTFSDELQDRASLGGPALQRGSRNHRSDGPGARAFRASGVVVADAGAAFAKRPSSSSRSPTAFA